MLNRDDAVVMGMKKVGATVFSFGLAAPQRPNEFGLLNENGMNWLSFAQAEDDDEPTPKRRSKAQIAAMAMAEVAIHTSRLMPADALKIRGSHNAMNALAALALCRAIGLSYAPLLHGLREYQGEPHRVELVASVAGVDYIDDSKGTNVGATVAAIKGLVKPNKSLLLIAGGVGKGQDFSPLLSAVGLGVSRVLLIGEAAQQIEEAIKESGVIISRHASLEDAVNHAAQNAHAGDIVLLSPACASFDMFKNYAHRAQVFIDAVAEVGYAHGEVGL